MSPFKLCPVVKFKIKDLTPFLAGLSPDDAWIRGVQIKQGLSLVGFPGQAAPVVVYFREIRKIDCLHGWGRT